MYIKVDKDLQQLMEKHAEKDDIDGMTEALVHWPEPSMLWLIYVDMRIVAPSSTQEHIDALKKAREKAIEQNPELKQAVDEAEDAETLIFSEEDREAFDNFEYTEEDQATYALFETIEALSDIYDEEVIESLDAFLARTDVATLPPSVQHALHKIIDAQIIQTDSKNLAAYRQSENYRTWYAAFAPRAILKNPDFDLDKLRELCELENEHEIISRKEYYNDLLETRDIVQDSFKQHLERYSQTFKYGANATDEDIEDFEKRYDVVFPEALKTFYKSIGELTGGEYLSIPSLQTLQDCFFEEKEYGRHLKSLSVMDMLNYLWGNDKSYLNAGAENGLSLKACQTLEANYTAIGNARIDDNVNLAIYYDQSDQFGIVYHDQDDAIVFDEYLEPMQEKSLAKYQLAQVLGALIICVSTDYMEFDRIRDDVF